jgi:hypothetical protein
VGTVVKNKEPCKLKRDTIILQSLQAFEDPILPGTFDDKQGGLRSGYDGSPVLSESDGFFDLIY